MPAGINPWRMGMLLTCLMIGAALAAQQPEAVQDEDGVYTVHADTHMVLLDVTVTDKHGQPATGLNKDDFKLLEDGQPQTIKFFEEHAPVDPAEVARQKAAALAQPHTAQFSDDRAPIDPAEIARQKAAALASQPPNTFTNFEPFTGRPVTILLLNELFSNTMNGNDSDPDQQFLRAMHDGTLSPQMRQKVHAFLDPLHQRMIETVRNATPDTPFAVYLLDSDLRLVQPITTDRALLLARVDEMWADPHYGSEKLINPTEYAASLLAPPKSFTGSPAVDIPVRRRILTHAMQQLASSLKGEPGRKNLFVFTGPFQCSVVGSHYCPKNPFPDDSMEYLCGLMDTLEQGRMSIYRYYAFEDSAYGFGCPKSADLGKSANYYTLYYTPTNPDWNGKYRATTVEVADKTGLHLLYRKGYYGTPENAETHYYATNRPAATPVPTESGLPTITATRVTAAPLGTRPAQPAPNPAALVFSVQVVSASATSAGDEQKQEYRPLALNFTMPANEFKVVQSNTAEYAACLELGADNYADSKLQGTYRSQVIARFDGPADPGIATSTIAAKLTLNLPAKGKDRSLLVTVRDQATGQLGSMVIPMEQVKLPELQ